MHSINLDLNRLARTHQTDLVFLVVGRHPGIVRHERKEYLSRLDIVARFNRFLG